MTFNPARVVRDAAGGASRRFRVDAWTAGTVVIAVLASIPIVAVIGLALTPHEEVWGHLADTVLPRYVWTTLGLATGVGAGTLVIGIGTAWLVTMCRFPGRRLFEWTLLLPMAIPAYVIAYVYTDLLEYAGPVQGTLRAWFGWVSRAEYRFPNIRSLGGAIAMMTLVLYPYVYLLSRAAFIEQSTGVLEACRTLGRGPWHGFFTVALPLARPAIVIGASLVMMETLNDFGTVSYFAVPTFTAGIFDVWLNMNNVGGAAQLASVLLLFVVVLIYLERWARRGRRFHHTTTRHQALPGYRLQGSPAIAATAACSAPLVLGFALPASVLVSHALRHYEETLGAAFFLRAANSLTLSFLAALLAVALGVFMAYGVRLGGGRLARTATRFASLGYAVPGAVLALGIIIPTAWLDNSIDAVMRLAFGVSTGLLLSGSIFAVTIGYVVRFLALSTGTVEASLTRITASMDGAARTLGQGPAATLGRVHMPLMRGSVLTAAILVFVDCMKELPMTVILRPFNFDTLATFVYQYASDERLAESSLAALAIVAAGVLPVFVLSAAVARSRPGHWGTDGAGP